MHSTELATSVRERRNLCSALTGMSFAAELWQLLQPGKKDSEWSVELRMQPGPNSKVHEQLATLTVRVAIQSDHQ